MQETWVQSLVWEDPLEDSMDCIVHGVAKKELDTSEQLSTLLKGKTIPCMPVQLCRHLVGGSVSCPSQCPIAYLSSVQLLSCI